ncbi:MerR family transcriptional regulator [Microlunatus spumicola]|uniref:MerR family transcriptional regulator n=1 Tax=Microlunatus spumicola TaxID=81499 RepID=UPI00195780DF
MTEERRTGGGDGPPTTHMQIGQVAERTELSVRTLRHWEEAGLVTPSARTAGGFRLYTERDVERLRTIRRMKPLGFTLDEMKQLLASLDVLAQVPDESGAASDEDARAEAAAFVAECHTRAEESCVTLRRQLAYAEEFRDLLAARG